MALTGSKKRLIDLLPEPVEHKEMKVLVLGLCRTGTTSIREGFKMLGLKTYGCRQASESKHCRYWNEAFDIKSGLKSKQGHAPYGPADFRKLLADWSAITDIPAVLFMDELIEAFPTAKIVVTNRNIDSWMRSMDNTVCEVMRWRSWWPMATIDKAAIGPLLFTVWKSLEVITKGAVHDPVALREGYIRHYAYVRERVPAEKRLEYEVKEGWAPLCKFLGYEIPGEEFPHANDSKELIRDFRKLWWILVVISAIKMATYAGSVGALAGSVWWYRRRYLA